MESTRTLSPAAKLAEAAYQTALKDPIKAVPEARAALEAAWRECSCGLAARAWQALGMAELVRGRFDEALALAAEAREDLALRYPKEETPVVIDILEADALRHKGELYRAFEILIQGEKAAVRQGDQAAGLRVRFSLGLCLALIDESDLSLSTFDEVIAEAAESGQKSMELFSRIYQCYALNALGRYEEALGILLPLEPAVFANAGPALHAEVIDNIGKALTGLGRPDEAEAWLRKALATERSLGREAYLSHTRLHLAEACLAQGRHAEAEGLARAVWESTTASGERELAAASGILRARCLELLAHWREAAELYRECLALREELAEARCRSVAVLASAGKLGGSR